MPFGSVTDYRRFVYWMSPGAARALDRRLRAQGNPMAPSRGMVCTALNAKKKVAWVPPEVWNRTCLRQGSWYRTSARNGQHLVVSAYALDGRRARPAAVISTTDFTPPRLAPPAEKRALAQDERLQRRMPAAWNQPSEREKRRYLQWARRLGSALTDFESLFLTHTANHGNFIRPRLYVEDDENAVVPYSIDRSANLCSCCLELFQVLGEEFRRKLIAPCPGAVICGRLAPDRYLLVDGA